MPSSPLTWKNRQDRQVEKRFSLTPFPFFAPFAPFVVSIPHPSACSAYSACHAGTAKREGRGVELTLEA